MLTNTFMSDSLLLNNLCDLYLAKTYKMFRVASPDDKKANVLVSQNVKIARLSFRTYSNSLW